MEFRDTNSKDVYSKSNVINDMTFRDTGNEDMHSSSNVIKDMKFRDTGNEDMHFTSNVGTSRGRFRSLLLYTSLHKIFS